MLSDSIRKYQKQANFRALIPFLQEKKDLLYAKGDTAGPEMAETLELLGESLRKLGRFEESKKALSQCLLILTAGNFADKKKEAGVRKKLGLCLVRLHAFEDAEKQYFKALELSTNPDGNESKAVADLHFLMGVLNLKQEKFEAAEYYLKTSLSQFEKILGKKDTSLVDAYNALGALYIDWSKPDLAEIQFLKCIEIIENQLSKNHFLLAFPLNNQANLYASMGHYDKASRYYERALEILILQYGPGHPELADCYNNLGVLALQKKSFEQAEQYIAISLEIKKNHQVVKEAELAFAIYNLGNINFMLERYQKAEKLYLESLSIYNEIMGENQRFQAEVYNNLAGTLCRRGKFEEAEKYYRKAIENQLNFFGPDNLEEAEMAHRMAMMYYMKGDASQATRYFSDFYRKETKKITKFFTYLSDEEKEKWVEKEQALWDTFFGFCVHRYPKNPAIGIDLIEFQMATKGILLSTSSKWRSKMRAHPDPVVRENFESWLQLKNKIFGNLSMAEENKREETEKLQNQADRQEKELNRNSENFGLGSPGKKPKFSELRACLKPGQALVEIIRTRKFGTVGTYRDSLVQVDIPGTTDTIQYAALVVKPESKSPELILFPDGNRMEKEHFLFYRKAIAREIPDYQSYRVYWQKLEKALKGCKEVYYSPDGIYHRINPLTLFNPSAKQYLLDQIDIHILTSGSDLLEKQNKKNRNRQAYLIGFPAFFGKDTPTITPEKPIQGFDLAPLPSTRSELEKVETILKAKNWSVFHFRDTMASESLVKNVKNPGILHLATHGFFHSDTSRDRNVLLNSGLMLANSGLSLSGQTAENQDDGILTSAEAMNLNLDSTELVVLSACETGLGEIKNGEGVYGLQRAIKVAGAESVMMSLWKVNDEATQDLMVSFYSAWLDKTRKAGKVKAGNGIAHGNGSVRHRAFAEAQKKLKKRFPSPYYWGPFVLVGE